MRKKKRHSGMALRKREFTHESGRNYNVDPYDIIFAAPGGVILPTESCNSHRCQPQRTKKRDRADEKS